MITKHPLRVISQKAGPDFLKRAGQQWIERARNVKAEVGDPG
jgi:hypothetical protein